MELGLTLGGDNSSTPFIGFIEKPHLEPSKGSFNTTLSIGPIITNQLKEDQQQEQEANPKRKNHHQLNFLPQLSLGGSSSYLDVNDHPPTTTDDEAALSGSSPNSAAYSFQMDLCTYSRGGGSLSGSGGNNNNKRDFSDEDDNNGGSGNTRKKLRLSKEQSAFLEESFKEHSTLNPKQKLALAKELNLLPRQVEVWFQNRRARTKLKQTEVDYEYLKRCCETLTEENRRLHKELQELRALKSSNPFYMQLPATTLTMCPSCERVATNSTTTNSSVTTSATINDNNTGAKTNDDSTSKANIGFPFGKPRFNNTPHLELN